MSNTAINITTATSTTIIKSNNNHQNEQHAAVASNTNEETEMKIENVNDGRQNQRNGEKGERERREDNVKRTPTMREQKRKRVKHINTNTDSVTSSTNEPHTCPSVDDSMTNRVLSSFNNINSSLSNNHSSRSTNTITSNPQTLHYISPSTSHPMPDRFREYELSYPSISRYGPSLAYRSTHYLDDPDEEIIKDEILEIIHLDHYPTLLERWGDDTKTIIRQEGEFKIEDYVEFDEIEPTIFEDVVYEINYTADDVASYREMYRTRSESRNFRKIRKRRIKCKHQTKTNVKTTPNVIEIDNRASELLNEMHNLSNKIDLIIQTGENFNNHIDDDLSGDECGITTNENIITKRLNEINHSDRSSNIDISSQYFMSDEQQKDFSEKIVPSESQLQSEASKNIPEYEEVQPFIQRPEQDLQLFLNSLLAHLLPESLDVHKQSFVTKAESTSNVYSSDQIEIKFHEKTSVDIQDATFHPTIDEQTSSESLTEIAHQIRTIPLMTRLPTMDSRVQIGQLTDAKEDELLEPCEITFTSQTKEDKKSSTDSVFTTQKENAHKDISAQKPSFDLQITESVSPIIDKEEHLLSNALPEVTREIRITPTPIYSSPDNINTEITQPIENILPQSKTEESVVQHTFENKGQSNSNVFSSPIEQTVQEEKVEDIRVPSDSLITPVTVDLPLAEVNPGETSTLPAETDKHLEIISTPISNDRQSPILSKTKEDENAVISSDSLADIIRQILSTALPIRHPSVDHTSISNEQIDTIISSSKPTAHIEDNELLQSNKTSSLSEIPTTPTEAQATLTSEDIKDESLHNMDQESNSSSVINHIDTEAIPDVHDILQQSIVNQSFPSETAEFEKIRTELPDRDYFKFEQTLPDFILADEKDLIPDLYKSYYELQDQRRIQPVLNYEQIEKKQEPSDINLHSQPQHFGLESFSLISNLPSREYRQVFGAPEDVISKVEDFNNHVASNTDQQSNISQSNEKPEMIEVFEDYSSIVTPDQVFINEDKSNSYNELDSRYSTLIDRLNSLIQPLLTYSSIIDNQPIPPEIQDKEEDDQRHLRERYDILIDHIKRLEETTHAHLIVDTADDQLIKSQDNLVETTDQRLNTPLRVVTSSYEKTSDELNNQKEDEVQTAESENEKTVLILPDLSSIASNDASNPPPTEEKHSSSVIDNATSFVNNVISSLTSALTEAPSTMTNKEILISEASEEEDDDDDEQHQPLITGLFEIMKNLLSKTSTVTSSVDNETISSETIPTSKTPEEDISTTPSCDMIDNDDCQPSVEETSNVITKPLTIASSTDINTDHKNEGTVRDDDKEHQDPTISNNLVESAKKIIVDTNEKIVPIQNQSTSSVRRQTKTTTSGYPWYTNQNKIADTEFDRLSSTQQSLADDESKKTSLPQQLQVISDDYPWYSSYYTIVDAEAKMYRINKKSSLVTEQSPSPATVKSEHQSVIISDDDHQALTNTNNTPANDEDKSQVVQHQKPLLTSTAITAKPTFSSDIDLEPVNFQEYSDEPITINKKKHKKKKTNKKVIDLDDASIPSASAINERTIETVQPEILLTSFESNTEIDNTKNESISSDTSLLLSTSISTLPQDTKVNTQPIEQTIITTSPTDHNSQSPVIVSPKEEGKDDDGFQLVHYRKRIQSSATTPTQIANSDVDLKSQEKYENQDSPVSTADVSQGTAPKKTNHRHKKQKKETISSSHIDWNNTTDAQQPPIEQETILQSQTPSPSIIDDSNLQSKSVLTSTIKTMKIPTKASVSPEEEEDDEGFQVVRYRKRITSVPKSQKPSLSAKSTYKQNPSRNTDSKTVTYGRHGSTSRSIPRTAACTQTPPNRSKQTSWSNTPARSASTDTQLLSSSSVNNSFRKPEANKQLSKDTERETIPDVQYKVDQSTPVNEPTQQTVEENLVPIKDEIKTTSNASVADTLKFALIENDDDGFRVVRHRKHTPSSPIFKQSDVSSPKSTMSPASVISQPIPTVKKSKKNNDKTLAAEPSQLTNTLSSLTTDTDLISTSEKEITHQNPITDPEQVLESPVITEDSTLETTIPQMNESVQRKDDIASPSSQIKEAITKKSNEVISIEPTTHIEDEQIKTSSSKQAVKRRKKKSKTNHLLSPTSLTENKSDQLIPKNPVIVQSKIETTEPSTSNPKHSTETNNKLDLFLPEYIRQHINPLEVNPSSTKKKQRPKMLTKDIEAKSLLTNEFDDVVNTTEEYETISNHAESIDDDDEFIIQTTETSKNEVIHSDPPNKSDQTIDNILSRGFHLWLQESQVLSQSKDKPLINKNLTHTMQSLIIQPVESNDEDESWNASLARKPTYMTGIPIEKRIHNASAYSINHPESLFTSSWLTAQSRDVSRLDTDEEDSKNDPSKKQHSHSVTTRSSANNERQASSIISSFEPTDSINKSFNFDDWAHFVEDKNSYQTFLSTCFYARTFDEDTLISDAIPIYQYKKQRYGDFLLSNDKPESMINQEEYISKPSDSFQRWQRQTSTSIEYENDDEIFLSHSNNGLSRRVRP